MAILIFVAYVVVFVKLLRIFVGRDDDDNYIYAIGRIGAAYALASCFAYTLARVLL